MKSSHRLLCVIAALMLSRAAGATEIVVTRSVELRADRYVDAASLRQIAAGTHVDLLKTEAGWAQVRVDAQTGWLRATGLTGDAASVSTLARIETGRSASGNIVVAAGIRGIPKNSKHALIIGVDALSTARGTPLRWPGVAHDIDSARLIARRIGVPDDNVEVVTGTAATFDGIGAAIDRLGERVQPGDQVLVYFSGPGTQVVDGKGCTGAWAAADGAAWSPAAVVERMRPVLRDADKLLVVDDAAYTALPVATGTTRKFYATPAPRGCAVPGLMASSLFQAAVAVDRYKSNLVVMGGISGMFAGVDMADAGGVFTVALTDCFLGDAIDVDGSTTISIAEIGACTNRRRHPTFSQQWPGMVAVSGNEGYSPLIGVAAASDAGATATATKIAATSPRVVIQDLFAQRDSRIDVKLVASPDELRIGQDFLDLTLTSSHAGYVYLVMLGSDGKSFYLLFPNDLDRDNRVAAGAALHLPRAAWRVQSQGPAGNDLLLAIVAESERDLGSFTSRKEGPFSTALTDADGRVQLQWLLGHSGRAASGECVDGGKRRNLAAVKVCSDAFGAAMIGVVER